MPEDSKSISAFNLLTRASEELSEEVAEERIKLFVKAKVLLNNYSYSAKDQKEDTALFGFYKNNIKFLL